MVSVKRENHRRPAGTRYKCRSIEGKGSWSRDLVQVRQRGTGPPVADRGLWKKSLGSRPPCWHLYYPGRLDLSVIFSQSSTCFSVFRGCFLSDRKSLNHFPRHLNWFPPSDIQAHVPLNKQLERRTQNLTARSNKNAKGPIWYKNKEFKLAA